MSTLHKVLDKHSVEELEPGYKYRLRVHQITDSGFDELYADDVVKEETGLEDTVYLQFVRGSKNGEGVDRYDGITVEQLLLTCKLRLEAVNKGDLYTLTTAAAIKSIEAALTAVTARTVDRQNRGVLATYQK